MDSVCKFFITTWYLWAVVLLVGLYRLFRPHIKGFLGEKYVAAVLSRLDKRKYLVFNNCMLQDGSRTTQIDHIVVSLYGLFVIETKNYKGWIVGGEHDESWTQVIYKRKEKLHNPILQNYGHIQALKDLLPDFPNVQYFPIVSFGSGAELKVKATTPVINIRQLVNEIQKHVVACISASEMEQIQARLQSANINNSSNRKAHIQTIRNNLEIRDEKINQDICPKCGGTLILRNGRYGLFKGCTNFPKCRFIAK